MWVQYAHAVDVTTVDCWEPFAAPSDPVYDYPSDERRHDKTAEHLQSEVGYMVEMDCT